MLGMQMRQLSFATNPLHDKTETENLSSYQRIALLGAKVVDFLPKRINMLARICNRRFPCNFCQEAISTIVAFAGILFLIIHVMTAINREILLSEFFSWYAVVVGCGGLGLFIARCWDGDMPSLHAFLMKRYDNPRIVSFSHVEERLIRDGQRIESDCLNGLYSFIRRAQSKEKWAEETIFMLSLGKSDTKIAPTREYKESLKGSSMSEAKSIIEKMEREYKAAICEMQSLADLWDGALGNFVSVNLSYPADMEKMKQIGDKFDIDIMLGTFYAGVPVEDIVA